MQERRAPAADLPLPGDVNVFHSMPRRKVTHAIETIHVALPRARAINFASGIIRPIARLFVWLWLAIQFVSGNVFDMVMRRDAVQRRAVRLRHVFEKAGPTFTK